MWIVLAAGNLGLDICSRLPICKCDTERTLVQCDSANLTAIPEDIPVTVEYLALRNNLIVEIKRDAFALQTKLKELWLDYNYISVIQPFAFRKLHNLKHIHLKSNKLEVIGDHAFSTIPHLITVSLRSNQIRNISKCAFTETETLETVTISSNHLQSIPSFGHQPKLETVIFQANQINLPTFPDSFENSSELTFLQLSQNKISTIDNNTFKALVNVTLSELSLSDNEITQITSDAFANFNAISKLKLGSNRLGLAALKTIMACLKDKNLKYLDLSNLHINKQGLKEIMNALNSTLLTELKLQNNIIRKLMDNTFSGFEGLNFLDLSKCSMAQTNASSFNGLVGLHNLLLKGNFLQEIPSNLPRKLTKLFLCSNSITILHNYALNNLSQLVELHLKDNGIKTVMQYSFAGLINLKYLYLSKNRISILPGKMLFPLVQLKSLYLNNNRLTRIQKTTMPRFLNNASLTDLDMSSNGCKYIQPNFFRNLPKLLILKLAGNEFLHILSRKEYNSLFDNLDSLKGLDISNNNITSFTEKIFQPLHLVEQLKLSNNKISFWNKTLFGETQNLQKLDLSSNQISTIKAENMESLPSSLVSLDLSNNPFECNCDLREFRDWMNTTTINLISNVSYMCNKPSEWRKKPLLTFDRTKIDCRFFKWWAIAIGCSISFVLVTILAILMYRKRWWIKLSIYKCTRKNRTRNHHGNNRNYGAILPEPDVAGPRFDAYISYAEADRAWVVENLLREIDHNGVDADDNNEKFSLYFEPRDGKSGSVMGNIFENISRSCKVIVVLSRNYLNDMNLFELDLAVDLMYKKEIDEIILIHIQQGLPAEKIPKHLWHTMKRNRVLEWGDNADARDLLKRSLIQRLSENDLAAERDAV